MYNFENYTLEIYETQHEYHREVPEHRFVAYLKEIPEASLHAYGSTHEEAIKNLREQFEALKSELNSKDKSLPEPIRRDIEEFSGKIVLRMPSWLHKLVDELADDEGISTNSYIVNRLIRNTTIDELLKVIEEKQEKLFYQWSYGITKEDLKPSRKKLELLSSLVEDHAPEYSPTNLKKLRKVV